MIKNDDNDNDMFPSVLLLKIEASSNFETLLYVFLMKVILV